MTDLTAALRSLGYREAKKNPGIWLKPVGYGLFVFNTGRMSMTQFYRQVSDGEPGIMSSKKFAGGTPGYNEWLRMIMAEETTFHPIWPGSTPGIGLGFPFIDPAEIVEL